MMHSRVTWPVAISLTSSALIATAALSVIAAHLVIPITRASVYVGSLTAIGATAFGLIVVLLVADVAAIAVAKLVVHEPVSRLVVALLGALAVCFGAVLLTGYMTAMALGKDDQPTLLLWFAFATTLVACMAAWRRSRARR